MKSFHDILGCEKQVKQLKTLCDYLKNTAKYEEFGAKIPEGVFMCGEGGVGKTLFAHTLAAESGRNTFSPSKKTKRAIRKAMAQAKKGAPSVLIFDDLDCYPREAYPLITKFLNDLDEDVFTIATATDIEELPEFLLEQDAFDERMNLDIPSFNDGKLIFGKFFAGKSVDEEFNIEDYCLLAQDFSASDTKSIYNEAALYAVSGGSSKVSMHHIFKAALKYDDRYVAEEFNAAAAYHEAGHAIVHLLLGGEAAYVVLTDSGGQYVGKKEEIKTYQDRQNDYIVTFAGNACEELFLGGSALGGYSDLGNVSHNIELDNKYLACQGFEYYDSTELNSPAFNDALAKKVQTDMQSYYDRAKKLLEENRPLVLAFVEALKQKNYLLHSEIHKIYNEYKKEEGRGN